MEKGIKYFFASVAARVKIYQEKDPKIIESYIQRMNEVLEERPKLKKIFKMAFTLYRSTFMLADEFYANFSAYKDKLPNDLYQYYDYAEKLITIKNSLKSMLKRFRKLGFAKAATTNDDLAQALAYQDITRFAALNDKELDKVINKYKQMIENFRKDTQQLKKLLETVKQDLTTKLKSSAKGRALLQKQEAFEGLKKFISKLANKVFNFTYKLYKQAALVANVIDSYIQRKLSKFTDAIINKIAGNNMNARMIIAGIMGFAPIGIPKALRAKAFSSIMMFMGPLGFYFGLVKFLSTISNLETSSYAILNGLLQSVKTFQSIADEIDKELQISLEDEG